MSDKTHSESKPGGLERKLRDTLRTKHYALQTEETYVSWYLRFVRWHGGRTHPRDMGAAEVSAFLTHLAVNKSVSAATQNQALNAIIFLYKQVLGLDVGEIQAQRAKSHKRLPVVLSVQEVKSLLATVSTEPAGLIVRLLYGCGLTRTPPPACLALRAA